MQYILNEEEYKALTFVYHVEDRNEALEVARKLIMPDDKCRMINYCTECPIGQIENGMVRDYICRTYKKWPK